MAAGRTQHSGNWMVNHVLKSIPKTMTTNHVVISEQSVHVKYDSPTRCRFHLNTFFIVTQQSRLAKASSVSRIHTIKLRHTTFGRTSLNKLAARRRDLYLTIHNIHKRQTSMSPAGFEPTIPASERPHTHALDRAATGIGLKHFNGPIIFIGLPN